MKIPVVLAFVCICLVKQCILGQQNLAVDSTALGGQEHTAVDNTALGGQEHAAVDSTALGGQEHTAVDSTALGGQQTVAAVDICNLPSDAGLCGAQLTRYYYNPATTHCEEFIYGGCGGNGNNFENVFDCGRTCGQTMPADNTGIAFPFI